MITPVRPTILHLAAVEFTATNLLSPQLAALQDAGFDVRVGCRPGPSGFDPALASFRPVNVDFPRQIDPVAMVKASRRLLGELREMRPAAIHLHTPAVAQPLRCIPRRLFPPGIKVFYTVHGFAHLWDTGKLKDAVLERTERLLAHRTHMMLFQSSEDFDNSQSHHYRTKLRYLGNGVGDEWFALPAAPRPNKGLRALFVGRLIRDKGIIDLLKALTRAPEIKLTIVGEQLPSDRGGAAEEVTRLIEHEDLAGRVRRAGRLSQPELRQEMLATDVVVLPSYREGVPRALIEGLAAGRPLVATTTRGCRELITDGVNGFLVPTGQPDRLAEALRSLATMSPDRFKAMGVASKQRALASHREQMVFDRLISCYAEEGIHPVRM
jgi:glycosyltransferase involved in cell wall biosynthesis